MRRLLALPLAAAALVSVAPAHAAEVCTPARQVGVCAGYECVDICGPEPYAYSFCAHPVPQSTCALILFRVGS